MSLPGILIFLSLDEESRLVREIGLGNIDYPVQQKAGRLGKHKVNFSEIVDYEVVFSKYLL